MSLLTLSPQEKDPFKIVSVIRQLSEYLSRKPGILLGGYASDVNLNSANSDNTIQITSLWMNWVLIPASSRTREPLLLSPRRRRDCSRRRRAAVPRSRPTRR